MSTEERRLDDRLDALQAQLDRIESKIQPSSNTSQGIGCLGIVLFLFVLSAVYESKGLIQDVLRHVAP